MGLLKSRRFISIDFGQAFLKAAYMEYSGGAFGLLGYDLKKNTSPEINKAEAINFIKAFLKAHAISTKETYLTISEPGSVIIRQVNLPAISAAEMLEAIKWQLKPEIPFDLAGAVIDWEVVKEYTDPDGAKKNEVTCVLARQDVIAKYLSIAGECRLDTVKISTSHFNYANLLSFLEPKPGIAAVLDTGAKEGALSLYKNNKLIFTRSLAFSSDRFTRYLAGTLVSDKGKIELSLEAAEEIKRAFGIPKQEDAVLKGEIRAFHVMSMIRPLLESLKNELKRSFDYFSAKFKEEPPVVLYLAGGGANIKNLDWYLNKELAIGVLRLPLPASVKVNISGKEKLDNDLAQIASAIGAVVAGPLGASLLPPEVRAQKAEALQRSFLRVASIVLAAIFLFSLFVVRFQVRDYRSRLRNERMHLDSIGEVKVFKEKMDSLKALVNNVLGSRVPVEGLLRVIAGICPGNIKLSELSMDQRNNSVILKGVVSGSNDDFEKTLVSFIDKLEAVTFFKNATVVNSRDNSGLHEFQIKCDLIR